MENITPVTLTDNVNKKLGEAYISNIEAVLGF